MIKQYEIRMNNSDKTDVITALYVRVEGLDRNSAILEAEKRFPNFKIRYIIAGPIRDVS